MIDPSVVWQFGSLQTPRLISQQHLSPPTHVGHESLYFLHISLLWSDAPPPLQAAGFYLLGCLTEAEAGGEGRGGGGVLFVLLNAAFML